MTDEFTNPPRRLKWFASLARWALWMLALGWLAIACFWGGLHFLIVPRIAEFRPWVEQQATRALGVSVQIGNIVARSNGLIPSVELLDVRLMDAQGRESLRLPSVLAALSPRSALGLGFEQLYIEGATLDVRRAANGRISIAGFELPDAASPDTSGADWVFSQAELAVRHGVIRWTDELRGAPPLELTDVDIVLRNRHFRHALRFDANPPSGWGTRFTLMGDFGQPLLSSRDGDWRNWTGQLYARADQLDFSHLRPYADLGFDIHTGAGALRAWLGVDKARIVDATADVSLDGVNVRIAANLPALEIARMSGRLGLRELDGGREYFTEALAVQTQDGLHWPGGNLRLSLWDATAGRQAVAGVAKPAHGELVADRLDLASLAQFAQRLPVGDAAHEWIGSMAPQGLVEQLQLAWQGTMEEPSSVTAKGRVTQLGLAAIASEGRWIPGIRGANVDFDVTQASGRATLSLHQGGIELPRIFDQPQLVFEDLSGDVQWKVTGDTIAVDVGRLKFSNTDAAGELQVKWQTADTRTGARAFPGLLDLQGTLSRAEATAVWRYLPTAMHETVREYLHQALQGGTATAVKYRVKGDLAKFPYTDAKQGEFRISATVQNATYAYAPASVTPKDSPPWPALEQVNGELVIEHDTLSVKGARGQVAGMPGLQFSRAEAQITRLYDVPLLSVTGEAKGPLNSGLALVNSSPLGVWTDKALARATATGTAEHRVKLTIPLTALEKATVQGSVVLAGNDLQMSPSTPRLGRVRGTVNYTETGFSLSGVQARALGGEARLEGGLGIAPATTAARSQPTVLRIQGVASAEGLRQARELGLLATLGNYTTGQTPYSASLSLRAGGLDLQVSSPLTGMAINLPAPLGKPADQALPLRFDNGPLKPAAGASATRALDTLQLELGRIVQASYVRDVSTDVPRVVSGSIGVGLAAGESAPQVNEGVAANLNLGQIDADAWLEVANALLPGAPSGAAAQRSAAPALDQGYVPTQVALRARELTLDGRKIANLLVGASRDGQLWRANVQAAELSGYMEYRASAGTTPGRVYARLSRLALGQSAATDVENLLDQQPTSIPALDVVVEDMELRGKKLGRVELQATNQGGGGAREWRLNRFNISTPEATLTATGNWVAVNAQAGASVAPAAAASARSVRERRRTVLNFKLDINDAGDLLRRFGMDAVVANGKGKVEGQVAWLGSPLSPDYPSMGGGFNVNVENGQFLKADPGIAKLLGVLSLQSLPRRLLLDFRDVFSDGFSFDFFRGDVTIEQGIARTNNLQMKGVNAAVLMEGQADIARETQLIKVVVIPEINAGSASLLTAAINPLVGLTTFLAQVILRRPLIDANTQELLIDGTWADPRVTKVERK